MLKIIKNQSLINELYLSARNFSLSEAVQCRLITSVSINNQKNSIEKTRKATINGTNNYTNKGLFNINELECYTGFEKLKQHCLNDAMRYYKTILSCNQQENVVELFDNMSNCICLVADMSEFIRNAHPNNDFKEAATNVILDISDFIERLNTDIELYNVLENYVRNKASINDYDKFIGKLFLRDFQISGVHLLKPEREQVVALTNSILKLNQKYINLNIDFERNISKLPKDLQESYLTEYSKFKGDNLLLNEKSSVRKAHYVLINSYNQEQDNILKTILKQRYELAHLCGYESFADRAISNSAAGKLEFVTEFLENLVEKLQPWDEYDIKLLKHVLNSDNNTNNLNVYDINYGAMKLREKYFNVKENQFSHYFTLNNCLNGLNRLVNDLFKISFYKCDTNSEKYWSNDVFKLEVHHQTEGYLGDIYCDFFQREGKLNQDCHFTIRGHKEFYNGLQQNPIVVIMLNLNKVTRNNTILVPPNMVDNLFHEMGHALASMFGRTKYQHVSGTRCSTDLAEVPSVLMEYFVFEPHVLKTYATHYKTCETIPNDLIDKLIISRNLLHAHELKTQAFYSKLDILFHGNHNRNGSESSLNLLDTYKDLHTKCYGFDYVPNTAWYLHFNHLITYGSKYYSYLFSRAISSLIWQTKFADKHDLWSQNGDRYRRLFLAHGGGKPPKQMIEDFLQVQITPESLSNALINDLKSKYEFFQKRFEI